jgi:hypothetical protein
MRRFAAVLAPILLLVLAAPAAEASPVAPYQAHPHGRSYADWTRAIGQFYLGDASNPLIAGLGGACGQVENGVFMMAAPVDLNLEFDCDVPAGMWIVFSNAGFFTTQGVDAQTDADLEALAAAGFHTSTDWLTLDGRNIPLKEFATGAYDVTAQSGSFYNAIYGLPVGTVRTALVADVLAIHPPTPGDHAIETAVDFIGDGSYSATYHLHVG